MENTQKQHHIHAARLLLRRIHSGVLATQSLSIKGFPFGSVTPFLLTDEGDIVIYASDIAQHSRNMQADPHVSLCVCDNTTTDSQASARVTVLATASADSVDEALKQRYFRLFPQARQYVEAHDFRFYRLTTQRVRYIGGFGQIYWFNVAEWQENFAAMGDSETNVIEHMQQDHEDALQVILQEHYGYDTPVDKVTMLTLFAEGFHVQHNDSIVFIPFHQPLNTVAKVREAMVVLTHHAREVLKRSA
ncbi:HugZ family protein [Alteromonas flava]|uniref:HugZ family pyridoxamine 5'-phosphate oxidase n=1 Tax=Alteromonas flava TaxID=2048003 RepID=UPI000C283684|nr:DUF2470 domain-containing protein [Alteromonas flava]